MKRIVVVAALCAALASSSLFYPATMVVDSIDGDTVTLATATGHLYEMAGAEDYEPGDLVSAIMFTNATPRITDDAIITARYSGFTRD